jgi:hypothetical protein
MVAATCKQNRKMQYKKVGLRLASITAALILSFFDNWSKKGLESISYSVGYGYSYG